ARPQPGYDGLHPHVAGGAAAGRSGPGGQGAQPRRGPVGSGADERGRADARRLSRTAGGGPVRSDRPTGRRVRPMAEYVFTLRNVRKAHGEKVILDNVTLSFLHGAKIGVVGPNGMGKSTLLRIMAGLDQPSNGDAILDPEATVGMLQQEPPLTEGKTVLENVEEA